MKTIVLAALAFLAACSGAPNQTEAQADKLDNAAEQSTPEAAAVLENKADAIRDNGVVGAPGEPVSTVQNAMQEAGEAHDGVKQAPVPGPKPTVSPDR